MAKNTTPQKNGDQVHSTQVLEFPAISNVRAERLLLTFKALHGLARATLLIIFSNVTSDQALDRRHHDTYSMFPKLV